MTISRTAPAQRKIGMMEDRQSEAFGVLLADLRVRAGLSRSQLAEKAEIESSYLYRLETGQRRPSREAVIRAAGALDLGEASLNQLLETAGYAACSVSIAAPTPGSASASSTTARGLASLGLDRARLERLLTAYDTAPANEQRDLTRAFRSAADAAASGITSLVKTAIVPAAGGQHRFLPAHIMQQLLLRTAAEAVRAGIRRIVFVLPPDTRAMLFDPLRGVAEMFVLPRVELAACEQRVPEGLGAALLAARPLACSGPFAVILPDDLVYAGKRASVPALEAMITAHARLDGAALLAAAPVGRSMMSHYGIVRLAGKEVLRLVSQVAEIAEKPNPSDPIRRQRGVLGIVGRYVLPPSIWDALEALHRKGQRPVELTAALSEICNSQPVYGFRVATRREDIGLAVARAQEALTPVGGAGETG